MSDAPPPEEPTQEPPEKPPVEIHKPHAAKTWKEFFIELGTVVLGILIALTLEQTVENWREHRLYREAAAAMRSELENNLGVIARRPPSSACTKTRIAELNALLDKAEQHQAFQPPSWVGEPSQSRLRYASESEATHSSLFSPEEQRAYGSVYSYLHSIDAEQDRERDAWAKLKELEGRSDLTPEMLADLRQAAAQARYEDEYIDRLIGLTTHFGKTASLKPYTRSIALPDWATCLPMNTPHDEALRRIVYPFAR